MDRSQKEKAVDDFKKIFEEAEAVIVTQYKGINAQGINDLRTQSRSSDVTFRVTQNRLIKIALEGGIYENIVLNFEWIPKINLTHESLFIQ